MRHKEGLQDYRRVGASSSSVHGAVFSVLGDTDAVMISDLSLSAVAGGA